MTIGRLALFLSLPGAVFPAIPHNPGRPVTFEPNVGQTDARVKYLAHAAGSTLWLTSDGATLGLDRKAGQAVLKLRFEGAAPSPRISGEEPLPGVSNYFLGRDPQQWRTGVRQFGKVRYHAVYPGIDVVFYGNPQQLEYDFILAPGADPAKIRLAFDGASRMTIDTKGDKAGDLVLEIGGAEIRNHNPRIYQGDGPNRRPVKGRFVMLGDRRAGFAVDSYDPRRPLVVDPIMTYGTFVGGSGGDYALALAADPRGNLYITGSTNSPDFPVKAGLGAAYKSKYLVAYVTKIDPTAVGPLSLIYSSYLGGTNEDHGEAIAVDSSGSAYITGTTFSPDFPLKNPFQSTINQSLNCNGQVCEHGFVSKISPDGTALVYSSFLGGSNADDAFGIAVDGSGDAYVVGQTFSTDFPTKGSPYQSALNGTSDAFLSKISQDGSALAYSTFFGGESDDWFNQISLDSAGNAYLTGGTFSTHAPVTQNAFQMNLSGTSSALVVKFNAANSGAAGLVYGTYLGGTGGDTDGIAVASDGTGSIYITGGTTSPNFPVSSGAFQSKYGGAPASDPNSVFFGNAPGDAFVAKLIPSASGAAQLAYSTYLGAESDDQGNAIAVTKGGFITVVGGTDSLAFPATVDAFQPFPVGNNNLKGFLARIDPSQSGPASVRYSTLLGGTTADILYGVAVDSSGDFVSVAGETLSSDVPVTPSAFQSKYGGSDGTDGDAFLARFDLSTNGPLLRNDSKTGLYIFTNANFTGTSLSPGLIFSLGGSGLGPAVLQGPALDPNRKVATTLAGVQVLVNGTPAPLIHVSDAQIDAVAPYEIAGLVGHTVNVQVVYNGMGSNIPNSLVVATAPGIYTYPPGSTSGAIVNQDGSINGANNPAAQGSTISIFATGEGQLNPPGVDGQLENGPSFPMPLAKVSVTVGGIPATVSYAGTAPQSFDGFLQVNAALPSGIGSGAVPVVLTVGGKASPPVNVTVR